MAKTTTETKGVLATGDPHAEHAVDQIKNGPGATVEVHIQVRSHFRKLVESKVLAGLPRDLAEDTARRQIEHDHGIDIARAALANPLDREEAIATAGVASNARQVPTPDRPSGASTPTLVKFEGGKKEDES